jgi:hypothetical protein
VLGVVAEARMTDLAPGVDVPVAPDADPPVLDDEGVPRRDLVDAREVGAVEGSEGADEVGSGHRLVRGVGDAGDGEELRGLGGEQDPARLDAVVERPHRERVAGEEETPHPGVPQGDGEVADEPGQEVEAPAPVGGGDERSRTGLAGRRGRPDAAAQLRVVVDAGVGDDEQPVVVPSPLVAVRHRVVRRPPVQLDERDAGGLEHPGPAGRPVRHGGRHPLDGGSVDRPAVPRHRTAQPAHRAASYRLPADHLGTGAAWRSTRSTA